MSVIEILAEIVAKVSAETGIPINYSFGSAKYIKEKLDLLSKGNGYAEKRLPMIALFCPVNEERNNPDYYSVSSVNIIIACSTRTEWSNEDRLKNSFIVKLRPIYESLIRNIKNDSRLDCGYKEVVKHKYSENYSYGRYGAYVQNSEKLSDPIDAIDIRDLEINIKLIPNCIRR